jgi:hypothetical protein
MTRRSGGLLLAALLGAWCAVAIACGGAKTTTAAAPTTAPAAERGSGDPHAEIDALDRQITDDLARAKAPPPMGTCTGAACAEAMSRPFTTPSITDPQCHRASSAQCDDLCTIATSICTNQERICTLARRLPGDEWAAGKCDRARASCTAAHERCCSCTL